PIEAIQSFLLEKSPGDAPTPQRLVEGEDSQAFTFARDGKGYVLRVNRSAEGFWKDDHAHRRFNSSEIPIPQVFDIGQIDEHHAFCITELMPGVTVQDSDTATVGRMLGPTFETWQAISDVDISDTRGYGEFDSSGVAPFARWREYLVSILDTSRYDWDGVRRNADGVLIDRLMREFQVLIEECPEERRLVHNDFGSNNILTDGERITAVLDWDCAAYGDPLMDVARHYFWSTWLYCVKVFADYCEQRLCGLPGYRERIRCYQLRVGLDEIYYSVTAGEAKMLDWKQRRCREILGILV
ncbi:MAG: phosphotransferase, partial [Chloroflexi bacterium]|nr:phosphotransferase [Chloroflexota bacterium]